MSLEKIAPIVRRVSSAGTSLLLGILVGILMHYLVYRLSLPLKPFVYVAF